MNVLFEIASAVAIISTIGAIAGRHPIHSLLYLVLSFISIAVIFFLYGAPFAGVLEVIIYAGAIMVLFVFAIMMLNLGKATTREEDKNLVRQLWVGPILLSLILLGEILYVVLANGVPVSNLVAVEPREVGRALFGSYLAAVLLSSLLLVAGLVGAYHLGRNSKEGQST